MRFSAAVIVGLVATGAAMGGGSSVVTTRQQAMKDMAAAAKSIAGMFKGQLPYDQRQFKSAAATISDHAGAALVAQFPLETLGPPSQAKTEIVASPEEFAALAQHLRQFAQALSAAADDAPDEITPAMRMGAGGGTGAGGSLLGGRRARLATNPQSIPAEHVFHLMLQDCTGCHALYREKP